MASGKQSSTLTLLSASMTLKSNILQGIILAQILRILDKFSCPQNSYNNTRKEPIKLATILASAYIHKWRSAGFGHNNVVA